jgi:hypothetical protein
MFVKLHLRKDIFFIAILAIIFGAVSLPGLNWDHVDLVGGVGSDLDSGAIDEALGYVHDLGFHWNVGYREYPQGYGFVLAGCYAIVMSLASLMGMLPFYEFSTSSGLGIYGWFPFPSVTISTEEARFFFVITARAVSALFGFLSVLLTYFIGRNYFQSRYIGFVSALLLLSVYPFIIASQNAKYPAVANFFFLLSFHFSLKLLEKPSRKYYIINGVVAGAAVSMIYFNGIALFVLFLVHGSILAQNGTLRIKNLFFNRYWLLAFMWCCLTFLVLNPRIFIHGLELLVQVVIWSTAFGSQGRADLFLYKRYEGPFAFLFYINDDVGLLLLLCMLAGIGLGLLRLKDRKLWPFLFVSVFYIFFPNFAQQAYIYATAFPIAMLLFTKCFTDFMGLGKNNFWSAIHIVFVLVLSVICLTGYLRNMAQNKINAQIPNAIRAREWIDQHIPPQSRLLIDVADLIKIKDKNSKIYGLDYVGGERVMTHNLKDLLWRNGLGLFDTEYAVLGSDMFSEVVNDETLANTPILRQVLAPDGVAYGFKETYDRFTDLVNQHAVLLHTFPKGRWMGDVQRKISYPPFGGIPLGERYDFFMNTDSFARGSEIRVYKLTPQFWRTLKLKLTDQQVASEHCRDVLLPEEEFAHEGIRSQSVQYHKDLQQIEVHICWQAETKSIMREVLFTLEHRKMPQNRNIKYFLFRGINQIWGKETRVKKKYKELILRESMLMHTQFHKQYILDMPKNLLNGDYNLILSFTDQVSEPLVLDTILVK